jgi:hypothetical protein
VKTDLRVVGKDESGVAMIEAAITLPLFFAVIFFSATIVPLNFNIMGTHSAFTQSLREISTGPLDEELLPDSTYPKPGLMEKRLVQKLDSLLRGLTNSKSLEKVRVGILNVENGDRDVEYTEASCHLTQVAVGQQGPQLTCGNRNIRPGSFVILETTIPFFELKIAGMSGFNVPVRSMIKVQEF